MTKRDKNFSQGNNKQVVAFLAIMVLIVVGFIGWLVKTTAVSQPEKTVKVADDFLGEKGEVLSAEGENVFIDESKVSDGQMHAFSYSPPKSGKNIHFFVVKVSDGTYRAAADACEACFGSKRGFKQVGDQIRCENCRTMYTKDQIALQKGGCNPRPIDKDVEVVDGRLAINLADIEKTADLF